MSQCPPGTYMAGNGQCVNDITGNVVNQTQTNQQSPKFGQTYLGGLISGIFGNLATGFGVGAGQSLNPQTQQPQIINERRDNTLVIVIIAVVVIGVVLITMKKK